MRMTIDVTADSVTYNVELSEGHFTKVCKRTEFGYIEEKPFPYMFRYSYLNIDVKCDTIMAR